MQENIELLTLSLYLQKQKAGLAALGEWKHINCLRPSTRDDIQDDILRKLFDSPKPTKGQEPKTKLQVLLSGIDLENIAAMDEILSLNDVPGGTISFLFEKSSTTVLEGLEDEEMKELGK